MTTPPQPPQGDPPAPETSPPATDPATEPPENGTFTAADRAALQKALAAEHKLHRDAAARLSELEAKSMTDSDKAWQEKVSLVQSDADAKLKKMAARAALASAGLKGPAVRLVPLLDLDAVTVGDDGEVTGLDTQVNLLKTEYPGLFGEVKANGAPPAPGAINIGNRTAPPAKPKTSAQILAEQITGGKS